MAARALRASRALLLNVPGGPDLTLREVQHIVARLGDHGGAEALLMTGMVCDPALAGKVWAMVFLAEEANPAGLAAAEKSALAAAPRGKATQLSLFGANSAGRF